jgi:uncharacterized protein (TIGR00661 family)
MEDWAPDLAICDFEPFLARAANRVGVPLISIDRQHGLLVSDLTQVQSIDWSLQLQAKVMGMLVSQLAPGRQATVVSGFHHAPLLPEYQGQVHQVGVFIRQTVKDAHLSSGKDRGTYLVAYVHKTLAKPVLRVLAASEERVKVYGLGSGPGLGKLSFHAIDERQFAIDLVNSRGLVSGAGNQLIGEAAYLNVPILAIPEPGSAEQRINAALLQDLGAGVATTPDMINVELIKQMVSFKPSRVRQHEDGLHRTMKVIKSFL